MDDYTSMQDAFFDVDAYDSSGAHYYSSLGQLGLYTVGDGVSATYYREGCVIKDKQFTVFEVDAYNHTVKANGNRVLTTADEADYVINSSASGIEIQYGTGTAINAPSYSGWVHIGYSSNAVTIGSAANAANLRVSGKSAIWKKLSAVGANDYVLCGS